MVAIASDFANTVRAQVDIVNAIVRRQIQSKYAESRMGFALALFEPVLFVAVLYVIRTFFGLKYNKHGLTLLMMMATGYMSHFGLRNMGMLVAKSAQQDSRVLVHPLVTVLDGIWANVIMSWLIYTTVLLIIVYGVVIFFGVRAPDNLSVMFFGFFCSLWMGTAIGMIFGVMQRYVPILKIVFGLVIRANIYFSGALYTADEIPPVLRPYMKYNPNMHMVEIMREGWVSTFQSPLANPWYVLLCCGSLSLIALSMERLSRYFKFT